MKKISFILILFLGLFFVPAKAVACEKASNSCEKKVHTTNELGKSCCDSDSHSENKGCNGSCGHAKCACASACANSSTSVFYQYKKINIFNFLDFNKVNFFYSTPSILEGHSSIWLIPKIS